MANPAATISTPIAPSEAPLVDSAGPSSNISPVAPPAGPLKWPTLDDVREDWAWAHEVGENYGFSDYLNKHVAIYNKTIVGSGKDYAQLRREMATKFGVHPERIIMIYIDSNLVDLDEGT